MRTSIEKAYDETDPNLGAIPRLEQAVRGKGYSRYTIAKHFLRLVPNDDYSHSDQNRLIDWLEAQSAQERKRVKKEYDKTHTWQP